MSAQQLPRARTVEQERGPSSLDQPVDLIEQCGHLLHFIDDGEQRNAKRLGPKSKSRCRLPIRMGRNDYPDNLPCEGTFERRVGRLDPIGFTTHNPSTKRQFLAVDPGTDDSSRVDEASIAAMVTSFPRADFDTTQEKV